MVCRTGALLAATLVVSASALQVSLNAAAKQEAAIKQYMSKAADKAQHLCLANKVAEAMKVVALTVTPQRHMSELSSQMPMEDTRRILKACFSSQGLVGEGDKCKLGSQNQCNWVSGCVNDNKCGAPPMPEILAQLKDQSKYTPDPKPSNKGPGSSAIKGDGPKVKKWEGPFPDVDLSETAGAKLGKDKYEDTLIPVKMPPTVWTSNPLTNLAITMSSMVVKGDDIDPVWRTDDFFWDRVVPAILKAPPCLGKYCE